MKELTSFEGVQCTNCTTPLEGEYCHHCGQSVHSVIRPVHGLLEEFVETILHVDGRILHTLPPLFLKPGFLTLEYFSGRRVRYIAPFRLMFVLCVLSFFTLHLAADVVANRAGTRQQQALISGSTDQFEDDDNVHEVQKDLDKKLAALEAARADSTRPGGNPAIITQIDHSEQQYREAARQRLTQLGLPAASASTASSGAPVPKDSTSDDNEFKMEPVKISWLPAFANQRLTEQGQTALRNMQALLKGTPAERQEARERLITNVFGTLPGAMLVLIPSFALLLAIFYIFKRRLYMEHLIVALHSHAFIFLSLLLVTLVGTLSGWLRPHAHWAGSLFSLVEAALFAWIPIYLLLMQKRIYRQGWAMTAVKFWFVGWCYFWLLTTVLSFAAVVGLAH
jgi:hypothetical protein